MKTLKTCWLVSIRGFRLKKFAILLLPVLSFFLSCSHLDSKKEAATAPAAQLKILQASAEKRAAISGTGFFSWKQKDKNLAAPGVLLVSWPDQLRLEVHDPMGGVQALLVMNADSFWWYSAQDKEILSGKVARFGQAMGFSLSAKDLVQAFLARVDFLAWQGARAGDCRFCVELEEKAIVQRLWWSDRLNDLSQWDKNFTKSRRSVVKWEDFTTRLGASFPEKTSLETYLGASLEQSISWVWNDWQPSVPNEKKLFEIPQEERFGRKIKFLP